MDYFPARILEWVALPSAGMFPTPDWNPGLGHCRWDSLPTTGSPILAQVLPEGLNHTWKWMELKQIIITIYRWNFSNGTQRHRYRKTASPRRPAAESPTPTRSHEVQLPTFLCNLLIELDVRTLMGFCDASSPRKFPPAGHVDTQAAPLASDPVGARQRSRDAVWEMSPVSSLCRKLSVKCSGNYVLWWGPQKLLPGKAKRLWWAARFDNWRCPTQSAVWPGPSRLTLSCA